MNDHTFEKKRSLKDQLQPGKKGIPSRLAYIHAMEHEPVVDI